MTIRPAFLLLVAAGCGGTISRPDEAPAPLIGGVTDNGDPSVVLVFAQQNGSTQGSLCTASVISPTVLLTAAHCVAAEEVGANVTFSVYVGTDWNSSAGQWLSVAKVDHDSAFNAQQLDAGHDVGIVVLQQAVSLTPLPINRATDPSSLAGGTVRLVGFGNNDGKSGTGAGLKRQVTTTLVDVSSLLLHIGDDTHETCQGDSGGPAFMSIGGVETIVGVTSFGYQGCTGGGYDTRVDLYTGFIDQYLGGGSAPPPPPPPPSCQYNCADYNYGAGQCSQGWSCDAAGQCLSYTGNC